MTKGLALQSRFTVQLFEDDKLIAEDFYKTPDGYVKRSAKIAILKERHPERKLSSKLIIRNTDNVIIQAEEDRHSS